MDAIGNAALAELQFGLDTLLGEAGPSVVTVIYVDGSPTEVRPDLRDGGAPSPYRRIQPRGDRSVSGRMSIAIHDRQLLDLPPASRVCYLPCDDNAVALVLRMPQGRTDAAEQRWLESLVGRLAEVRETDGRLHRVGCTWQNLDAGELDVELLAELVDLATAQAVGDAAMPVNMAVAKAVAERRRVRMTGWRPDALLRRLYGRQGPGGQIVMLLAISFGFGWLIPFGFYAAMWGLFGINLGPVMYGVVLGVLITTALTIYVEALFALDPSTLPRLPEDCGPDDPLVSGRWPGVTALYAAYLPNEIDTICESVEAALAQHYPGELQVVVAYNGADRSTKATERRLQKIAANDSRLMLVGVPGSTSKAQNVNAGMRLASGDVVGVFDADHRPAPGSFERAARWIGSGSAEAVQGHCVIRNPDDSVIAGAVAVEFEGIYAVAHPGRASLHGFGIFGGSNGYWWAPLLRQLRMRPWMLTEDIDASIRGVIGGARIVSDPALVSRELAPTTARALWDQRMRWSQGWSQVSRRYFRDFVTRRGLTVRQRVGGAFLLGWREIYPWLSMQMVPVLAYQIWIRHQTHIHWLLPIFIVLFGATTSVGPVQALFAWRLAVPELRHRRWLFLRYLLVTGALYGEARNAIGRCAHVREWLGDVAWRVTPRGVQGVIISEAQTSLDGASGDALGRS
jgi:glycosyltransferase involved in cell wall biosynthesis